MTSVHDQIANRCRFFNGIQNSVCLAGVKYEKVVVGCEKLPCLKNDKVTTCTRAVFPTEKQIKAKMEWA